LVVRFFPRVTEIKIPSLKHSFLNISAGGRPPAARSARAERWLAGLAATEQVRARLAAIVECSDDAIIGKTLQGIITSWNGGAERIFGHTEAEAMGKPLLMLLPPERAAEEEKILERISRGERIPSFESVRIRKGGTPIDVSITISPVIDPEGKILGASKIARDISWQKERERENFALMEERRKAEETIRLLNQSLERRVAERTAELESANQDLEAFTYSVSHDLRSPLRALDGYSVALLQESGSNLPDESRRFLTMIQREARRMTALIDDLLNLSRLGRQELRRQPVAMGASLRNSRGANSR